DLEWMSVAGTYDGSLLDGPQRRVAIPAVQVLAVEQKSVAFLFLLWRQLIQVVCRGGACQRQENGKLHDFMTSSQVTSRCSSIAMRPIIAVSVLSADRTPVFSGLPS